MVVSVFGFDSRVAMGIGYQAFGLYILLVMMVFAVSFFFFKQKTAYEMRISDWSSDVCSSDLLPRARSPSGSRNDDQPKRRQTLAQIGRASCRERVCQSCRSRWSPYH